MENKNDNIYYIYNVLSIEKPVLIEVGIYNPEYNVFYNEKSIEVSELNDELKDKIEIGRAIKIDNKKILEISDTPNKEIKIIIEDKQKQKETWENNNPDTWPNYEPPIDSSILLKYFLINKIEDIDYYILESTILVAKAMGIKQRYLHDGSYYDQCGLEYPEELEMIGIRLYELIKEYLDKLKEQEELHLLLYEYGNKGLEYEKFTKELNKRTGYQYYSDLEYKIRSIQYHSSRENAYSYLIQKPMIILSREKTSFISDISNPNSERNTITNNKQSQKTKQK